MAGFRKFVILLVVAVMHAVLVAATPPGIANNPSNARCLIAKYKHCYNLVHVCPKFCPDSCTVECVSCKPICGASSSPPPPPPEGYDSPPPPPSVVPTPPNQSPPSPVPSPPPPTPPSTPPSNAPSPSTPATPAPTPPTTPSPPTPQTPASNAPSPSPSTPPTPTTPSTPNITPTPPTPSPNVPSPPPPTPSTPPTTPSPNAPSPPPPTPPTPTTPSPNVPSPPPPTPPTPTTPSPNVPSPPSPTPTPATPSTQKAKCKKEEYPLCYDTKHVCPNSCPGGCEVDCVTCKPVCSCDKPGAVCQDPRFIGGDGITFYFHGQKDHDFCLVSDPNLHINAHFIGKRNENMSRDFTWVQSIVILFNKHRLLLAALKTSTWDDSADRIFLAFNGEPLTLPNEEGYKWQSKTVPTLSITRVGDNNNVVVEVEGNFKITAKVVPIGEQESRVHNYGITKEDCFAHLDLGFKFYSLSDEVNGVLGQTYKPGYVSHVNVGAKMPVLGRHKDFITSSLFAPDCAVTQFSGDDSSIYGIEMPSMRCESGMDGQGVVCRR